MKIPKNSYIGRHAELYDIFYSDKPYDEEASFIHYCLQHHGKKNTQHLLELACGTGTHSMLLEKYGYKIIATDYSPEMIAQAKAKAAFNGSSVDFRIDDMRNLEIVEKPFDAIICLFDSIGYLVSNESILKVLAKIREHLCYDGLFIFEFWHAGAMIRGFDPLRIRRWKTSKSEIIRTSETRIDYKNQVCSVTYSIFEHNLEGSFSELNETQINRFFLIQEMSLFLLSAGFLPLKWFSGFQNNENIDENSWHVVVVAKKK